MDFSRDLCFLKRFCVGETAQIAASGFLNLVQETGHIPDCSFYLPFCMCRDATAVANAVANAVVHSDSGV